MGAELSVPTEAAEKAIAVASVALEFEYVIDRAVEAAAPLIVAAELQRLAGDLDATRLQWREEDNRTLRSSGLGYAVGRLRARASELRGEV